MTRIFLGISSSEYEDNECLPMLPGARLDGQNITQILLDSSLGNYSPTLSRHLTSPTLTEVQNAINEILFVEGGIDCFTLYFAGHGISQAGTYYLCMRNTYCNQVSATALPLNYIFNVVNDVKPIQSNIIIDACQAGGLVGDLGSLIKPEVFGRANSPSVSLFGSSMRGQNAEENDIGGYATQALVKYIKGEICIDTHRHHLDLVHIGRCVSNDFISEYNQQTPVVWGLCLTGISTFTKNPHFRSGSSLSEISIPTFISSDLELLKGEKEKIWNEYIKMPETGPTVNLVNSLVRCVHDLKAKNMDRIKIASFLLGTAEGLVTRTAEGRDRFSEVEVLAACGAAFLPILDDFNARQSFISLTDRIVQNCVLVIDELVSCLDKPDALLSKRSDLADLFFLPIRISKVLGWIALGQKIQRDFGLGEHITDGMATTALNKISDQYKPSFACVSNEQAPYLMIYTQMGSFLDGKEILVLPIRCYFDDFIKRKGKIATSFISGEDVLSYLLHRYHDYYTDIADILEQPSELLSVFLNAAVDIRMDDEIDPYMQYIDHLPFNIFIPDNILSYSEERILDGVNITMQIGSESGNGVFYRG